MLRSLITAFLILLVLGKSNTHNKPAVLDVKSISLTANLSTTTFPIKDLDPAKAIMIVVEQTP
jgi:hypothetical protein